MFKNKFVKILLLVSMLVFIYHFVSNCFEFYNEFKTIDWQVEIQEIPQETLEELNIKDINNITTEEIELLKNKYIEKNLIWILLLNIGISLLEFFLEFFPVWLIVIAVILSNKKVRKSKLSSTDLNKYNGYFRDVLNEYSVSVLSYIDDFKLVYPGDLIAMLLQLEYKKIISFNEDRITINQYNGEVKPSEKIILDSIENGKLKWFGFNNLEQITRDDINAKPSLQISPVKALFEQKIKEEGISCGLLEERGVTKKLIIKDIIISILVYMVAFIILFLLINNLSSVDGTCLSIIYFMGFLILSLFIMFFPMYKFWSLITLYINMKKDNYFRTKKGEEVNKKLEGLKNFLKDFSILSEREKHEITLWDEYLIYSVLFNHNNGITDKYKKLIN